MTGTELIEAAKKTNVTLYTKRLKFWMRQSKGKFTMHTCRISAAADVCPALAAPISFEDLHK